MAVALAADTVRTLHRIHRQLADLRDRLAAGPRQLDATSRQLAEAEARKAAAQDEVKRARVSVDQKQLQLKSSEARIRDLEVKLNACKTNREYQTLRDQIAADTMAMKVLEDEILDALEKVDSLKPTVPAADAEVVAIKRSLDEVKSRVQAEASRLDGEVARVRTELETTERDLADDVRERYLRVVKQKGEDGLSAADGETCGGCFQRLTSNMASDLLLGRLVTCRNCGRLLYAAESAARG